MNAIKKIIGKPFCELINYSSCVNGEIKERNLRELKSRIDSLYGYHVMNAGSARTVTGLLTIAFYLIMASILISLYSLNSLVGFFSTDEMSIACAVLIVLLIPHLISIILIVYGLLSGLHILVAYFIISIFLSLASLLLCVYSFFADHEFNTTTSRLTAVALVLMCLSRLLLNSSILGKVVRWTMNSRARKVFFRLKSNYKL